jgi:hypothetical protein
MLRGHRTPERRWRAMRQLRGRGGFRAQRKKRAFFPPANTERLTRLIEFVAFAPDTFACYRHSSIMAPRECAEGTPLRGIVPRPIMHV